MNKFLLSAASIALLTAIPASAQILGGGGLGGTVGGTVGGTLGGARGGVGGTIGGTVDGTIGGTVDRTRITAEEAARAQARAQARAERERLRKGGVVAVVAGGATLNGGTRVGERRIDTSDSVSAFARLSLDERLLRTRGAVSAVRRGLRRVGTTASGVQVFVPQVVVNGPLLPVPQLHVYPAYSSVYYTEPGAVLVEPAYVDTYMDQQYQDLEGGLRGSGATVTRRGRDLVVLFPADVTFAFDKSDIRPRFFGALSSLARTLNAYPGTDIEVEGHTDSIGSDAYNMGLSERRGRAVADFLAAQQVSPTRMVVEGMGESEPIASNATVEGRAANRRVEFIVHPRAG